MKILYPVAMSILPGQKYNAEIVALAIMGQAGAALSGSAQYIETTPQRYKAYCAMAGLQMMPRLIEIINDGGEVTDLELFIYAPNSILNVDVPLGVRFRQNNQTNPATVRKFATWNDGGTQPIFHTNDNKVILRTNLGGTSITYQEILILAAITGVQLLDQGSVQALIN